MRYLSKMNIETYKKKAKAQMKQLEEYEDKYTEYVMKIGKTLFEKELDQLSGDYLSEIGIKLTGIGAYLGNKISPRKRAERDTYEQLYDEAYNNEYLSQKNISGNNTTDSRSIAKQNTADLKRLVISKEYEKNQIENIIRAIERMTSFIQSCLKIKDNEKYGNYE